MTKRTTMLMLALFALLCAAPLSACHTTAGAGEDISNAGHAIQHDADHATPNN
jgi:predicted small secreted protein